MRKHQKLAASVFILLALWAVSIIQNKMAVIGAPGPATVAIVQTANSNPSDAEIESMVRDAVAKAGGLGSVINIGDQVVVKPNLVGTIWPNGCGVITNKTVVRTVVKMAQEAGAGEVIIAEGSGSYTNNEGNDRFFTRKAFKDSGLDTNGDMIDDVTGVQLFDLNITCDPSLPFGETWADPNYVRLVDLQDGLLRRTFYQSNLLLDCDVLITVPVLKNHGQGAITGGLKNRVGCTPCDLYWSRANSTTYGKYKHELVHLNAYSSDEKTVVNRAIMDLNRARPADFCVTDGLVGVTNGPVGSYNVINRPNPYVRCILASKDTTACDTIQALLMGISPESVKHLMHCRDRGFGQTNPAFITVVGKSVKEARDFYANPPSYSNLFPNGYGDGIRCDLTAPTLSDITPDDGVLVNGTITVSSVGASDNNGIIKSELYIDNQLVASNAVSPFSLTFDSGLYSSGPHALKVKVYDSSLNEASHTHTVMVGQQEEYGSITGLVKDESDNPISGATVSTNTGGYTTTTDASGIYTLSNVFPGTYNVTASKTGYASSTNNDVIATAGQVTTSNFTIQVNIGTITGTVKDAGNVAISGATVSTNTGGYTTTTNSSGVYTLSSVGLGTYNVTASKAGYTSLTNNSVVVTAASTTTSNFTLQVNTGTITGTVKDAGNVAISGATVSTNTGGYTTTTNSSGVYTFSTVTAGTYNVTATKTGYTPQTNNITVTAANTTTSNFTLQVNTGTITGTVRDAGNTAISGVTVSTNTGGYTATTNSSGVYTLSNVTAGTYNVTATKTGYSTLTNDSVTVTATNTTTSNFTLSALAFSIAENFETVPTWSSTYNAPWGDAANWACVSGGQSGNFLQATRPTHGSSINTIVYTVPTNTTLTVSGYMRCPNSSKNFFTEFGFRLGTWNGSDFDGANRQYWTSIKKFALTGGYDLGNGNVWTKYSAQVNTGTYNKITLGFKTGAEPGDGPIVGWDTLRIDGPPVCVPPAITTHPISTTVVPGGSATFSVSASGSTPLTYAWRKNGTNISGATNSTYTIGSVASSDVGSYNCVVSNSCGTATSNSAALVTGNFMAIMEAKGLANGTGSISLMGKLVTATFGDDIYVEEPGHLGGLRLTWPGNSVLAGQLVDVTGSMETNMDSERYLNVSVGLASGTGTPKSIFLTVRDLGGGNWQWDSATGAGQKGISSAGLNNIGLLVKIFGTVKQTGTGYMYVNDGSNVTDGTSTGVRVICDSTGYQVGDFVSVTGISSCYQPASSPFARRILTRGISDVVKQ